MFPLFIIEHDIWDVLSLLLGWKRKHYITVCPFDNCFFSYGITSNTNQHITHEFATDHLVSLDNIKGEANYYFFSNKVNKYLTYYGNL